MCVLHSQHVSVVSSCISSARQSHVAQHGSKKGKKPGTPMFSAVLLAMVKTWKQLKCPLKDEWIRRCTICTMEYHPGHSRNETISSAATRAGLEITLLSDGGQTEKDQPHKVPLTCRTFCLFHTVHEKGKKLGTEYAKSVYCHRANLTYMQGTSGGMLGWMKHRLE